MGTAGVTKSLFRHAVRRRIYRNVMRPERLAERRLLDGGGLSVELSSQSEEVFLKPHEEFAIVSIEDQNGDGVREIELQAEGSEITIQSHGVELVEVLRHPIDWAIDDLLADSANLFGFDIATADLNQDGEIDYLVSAPGEDSFRGAVYALTSDSAVTRITLDDLTDASPIDAVLGASP